MTSSWLITFPAPEYPFININLLPMLKFILLVIIKLLYHLICCPIGVCLIFIFNIVYVSTCSIRKQLFKAPVFKSKFYQVRSWKEAITTFIKCMHDSTLLWCLCKSKEYTWNFFISFSLVNSLPSLLSSIFFRDIHFYNSPSGINLNKICEEDIVSHSVAVTFFMDGLELSLEYGVVLIS